MPEFFRTRFPRSAGPVMQRLILWQERASILAADAVLTVNDALAARLISLGVPQSKVTVVLNSPDLTRFDADTLRATHLHGRRNAALRLRGRPHADL